ncbi:MAG: TldD/PmbA family protein [Candidatus Eisenbacteria bacterium]|nr:TldD/PmbA family protein [Candidatus Eisenbacteria bacterium]
MNKEMLDLAASSIKAAKSAGADDCRVQISRERFVEISYRERKPETIKEASSRGLFIEIFANGRYSGQSTSDLRKEPLQAFISNAVATTKLLAEDPFRSLPDPKYYAGRAQLDLQILDPSYAQLTPEARHSIVKTMEDSCLSLGGDKVISVTAEQYDSYRESVMLSSNGFEGYRESTEYQVGASMSARDEGDRRPMGYYYAGAVSRKTMPRPEEIGALAAKRTLSLFGGKKIQTETLPIIVENQNVPRLLGAFLQAMSGRSIQQKQSFLSDKKGQKVGSDQFTLIDDPLLAGGLGSRLYDSDGFAAKERTMVESGVLNDFYVDWYYGRKLGWEPTTGRSSNLIIPPGKRSVEEIMKDLGRGIYITGFIGGNSNSTTGDSSIGIFGQLFEKGEPVQAIAEMNIADNHLKFWNKLAEVGNDPWVYSSQRSPSLVFTDVVVSGV